MKSQKTVLLAFYALLLCIALFSCKKDGNDKQSSCRIVTATQVHPSGNTTINITYNNDKKISTLSTSGGSVLNKVYTYSGNTLIINSTTGGGTFSGRDSLTLDNRGRPMNIRQYFNQAGTDWRNMEFTYNGDEMLKYVETSDAGGAPVTYTATYANGNMTSLGTGGTPSTIDYYTDKNVQPGDFLELQSLIQYGVSVFQRKNLVKAVNSPGSDILNFNYEYDADGLITKVTGTAGTTVTTVSYQYQCD